MLSTIRFIFVALPFFLSFAAQADESLSRDFKAGCVKAWMNSAPKDDKIDYQNFGEKYCGCASTRPLKNQDEINKAAQSCMAQTLLRDTMDTLEEKPGLNKVTPDDILTGCKDKWAILYPETGADPLSATNRFCECAQPRLVDITKNNENLTDDQWYEKIDIISADCAQMVIPEKATTDTPAK